MVSYSRLLRLLLLLPVLWLEACQNAPSPAISVSDRSPAVNPQQPEKIQLEQIQAWQTPEQIQDGQIQGGQAQHQVRRGDTLFAIAFRTGVSVQELANWNALKPPYTIYVGEKLWLRPQAALKTAQDSAITGVVKPAKSTAKPTKRAATKRVATKRAATKLVAAKPLPKVALPKQVAQWVWPVRGKLIQKFSLKKGNNGIQIAAPVAAPVAAAAAGQVIYAGSGIRGYGELIIIQHSPSFLSAYAHNSVIMVQEGQRIKQGQKIAEVGDTGTNKIKLHFEIRKHGKPVNPLKYLPPKGFSQAPPGMPRTVI